MAQSTFQKIKSCNQRDKDIVYGYIKRVQTILPHEQNPYFIIVQLIQNLILLYFHNRIDSKLLTEDEQYKLFKLFRDNARPKFLELLRSKSLKVIFESSAEDMNTKECIEKVYGKQNILVLIHSGNNNICGGYTSNGWPEGSGHAYIADKHAFIFSIRSCKGYEPKISYVKASHEHMALRVYSDDNAYLMFSCLALYIWKTEEVCSESNSYYQPFPN